MYIPTHSLTHSPSRHLMTLSLSLCCMVLLYICISILLTVWLLVDDTCSSNTGFSQLLCMVGLWSVCVCVAFCLYKFWLHCLLINSHWNDSVTRLTIWYFLFNFSGSATKANDVCACVRACVRVCGLSINCNLLLSVFHMIVRTIHVH